MWCPAEATGYAGPRIWQLAGRDEPLGRWGQWGNRAPTRNPAVHDRTCLDVVSIRGRCDWGTVQLLADEAHFDLLDAASGYRWILVARSPYLSRGGGRQTRIDGQPASVLDSTGCHPD